MSTTGSLPVSRINVSSLELTAVDLLPVPLLWALLISQAPHGWGAILNIRVDREQKDFLRTGVCLNGWSPGPDLNPTFQSAYPTCGMDISVS